MSEFGRRLKQERERLGLNQAEFGDVGGVKKNAQSNYELGERFPSAEYLERIATKGADILYIVTGQAGGALTPDESALVAGYRAMDDRSKAMVMGMIGGYTPPPGPSLAISGSSIGQVVQGNAAGGGTVTPPSPPVEKKRR